MGERGQTRHASRFTLHLRFLFFFRLRLARELPPHGRATRQSGGLSRA